MWENLVIQAI